MTQLARRADLTVNYNGKDISAPLTSSLISLTYTDAASGQLDDLQITLQDREQLWQGDWSPTEGDSIDARIKTTNWLGPNKFEVFPIGTFEVDSLELIGPPDQVTIKALSLPAGVGGRREKTTRAWEKVTLKTIASDIAGRSRLKLMYQFDDNPTYDRIDQSNQTDFAFLMDLCDQEGIAVKVTRGTLVLFNERKFELQAPSLTLQRSDVLSYTLNWSTTDAAYRACQLTYSDAKTDKTIRVTYTPPGAPRSGPVLKVNDSASSEAEALRIARNRLREQNKNYGRATLALPGDTRLSASITLMLSGWRRFDAKYIVDSATHTVDSNGYTTQIEIRKVLGW